MRIARNLSENGVVAGNTYDKYGSRNPFVRYLMRGFETSLQSLVKRTGVREIHEVGCGEGYWTLQWLEEGYQARGSDFSTGVIRLARMNAADRGIDADFKVASIYGLVPERDSAELIVCCEVLEHLEDPEQALRALREIASRFLIISVPQEPLWRILNFARGHYWRQLGNTPGHLQHWSQNAFIDLIGKYFRIVDRRTPLPWTMILAKCKV
jgi:ubiquinone/menaquinone biosynthesis C-methylase UbiE